MSLKLCAAPEPRLGGCGVAEVAAFVLNFNGRVTMASVKNFQLVLEDDGTPADPMHSG